VRTALVLVEGQTEERFIKEVLQPHLATQGVWVTPTILRTSGLRQPVRKGGVSSWSKMRRDLQRLAEDTSVTAITTLLDYYGLPDDVPGMSSRPARQSALAQVVHVEAALNADLGDPRFRAYVALHELEALLFAEVQRWAPRFDAGEIARLCVDVAGLEPEAIDDGVTTAPSKRLERFLSKYRKTLHGPVCIDDVGLELVRVRCPHFGEWLTWLEQLANRA
jgi:hypothetical protein